MSRMGSWQGSSRSSAISAEGRARDAWRRICDKPTSITLVRIGGKPKTTTTLNAQTVRVEYGSGGEREGSVGEGASGHVSVTLFGVKGHPDVDDTDIQRDDRFALDGKQFRVISLVLNLGEVQAWCEALE